MTYGKGWLVLRILSKTELIGIWWLAVKIRASTKLVGDLWLGFRIHPSTRWIGSWELTLKRWALSVHRWLVIVDWPSNFNTRPSDDRLLRCDQDSDSGSIEVEIRCSGPMMSINVADRSRAWTSLHFRVVGWCKAGHWNYLQVGAWEPGSWSSRLVGVGKDWEVVASF